MNKLLKGSQRFLKKNSATILTCVGAVGVVGTAVVTAKAATKASKLLDVVETAKGEELTIKEKVKISAPIFIPSIMIGAATITCIFGANYLNKRQQASLIGAYTMLDQSYKQYKDKVEELYGIETINEITDAIARDNLNVDRVSDDKELFYDTYSGRYFESTLEDVLKAEHEMNKMLTTGWGVGINDFYKLLGMDEVPELEDLGWNSMQMEEMYWHAWIEFDHRKVTIDESMECTVVDIPLEPIIDYLNY